MLLSTKTTVTSSFWNSHLSAVMITECWVHFLPDSPLTCGYTDGKYSAFRGGHRTAEGSVSSTIPILQIENSQAYRLFCGEPHHCITIIQVMSVIPRTKVILFSNRYLVLKSKLWLNTIVTALSQVVYFYNPISSELCNIRKKK